MSKHQLLYFIWDHLAAGNSNCLDEDILNISEEEKPGVEVAQPVIAPVS